MTVATNKAPLGPYRGVGRPGACFAIERTIDEIARAVGRDPAEVRIDNMVPPRRRCRSRSVAGMRYDTGDYPASVRLCAELLNAEQVRARQQRGEAGRTADRHRLRQLHRADRARRRRIRLARRLDHPRLRELHRAHPDRTAASC